jgi:glycerophosphoryl diester phosphodiesterase
VFTLIAHRGFSSSAPENTIAAFDLAIDEGFDNIELDAHLSADGVPVVIHDDTLDRTTNGSGPVSSLTLAELRDLDAGAWFGNAHMPVPLFPRWTRCSSAMQAAPISILS